MSDQAQAGSDPSPVQPSAAAPPPPSGAAQVQAGQAHLAARRSAEAANVPLIGPDLARYESIEKVTGRTKYAGDVALPNMAYAYAVTSPVARGRIEAFDASEAMALPGVVRIYDHMSMQGRVKPIGFFGANQGFGATSQSAMAGPDIAHDGQIVGLVVADTYEAAREAARRVRLTIAEEKPAATFDDPGLEIVPVAAGKEGWKDPAVGDAEAALSTAAFKVDGEYATPTQHHNAIELFSTTCAWDGDELTIHEPSAGVNILRFGIAGQLGVPPDKIVVHSPFIGGSFGSKVTVTPRTTITAAVARDLGRPVKLVLTREQGFTNATHRAETRHRVRLAATPDGKLTAYGHEGWEVSSRADFYSVNGTENSIHMYAWPAAVTKVNVVKADRNTPGFMRSPPEVPYIFALEVAMDEMAERAGVDPVEFRKINDVRTSAYENKSYTSRSLNQCLDVAASAFGWDKRDPKPGSMRDGDWLIGHGVAMATYPTAFVATAVRLSVKPDGAAVVQLSAHDIGTGAYGVAALTAAQELGLDIRRIRVEMGDSRLPPGPIAGGSVTTASICNAIAQACANIREKLDVPADQPVTAGLKGRAAEEYLEWLPPGTPPEALPQLYQGVPVFGGGAHGDKLRFAFGAEFVEVRINARTREIRVPRIIGAFAAGRIMNARTARSQLLGGMIWGIGSALHEYTEIDRRAAKYVNDNIAEYLIPVNADIPSVEIIMIPEEDRETNVLGIKGLGELGNVGTPAAIANAVYHATGKRIRDLPIRIEDVLDA